MEAARWAETRVCDVVTTADHVGSTSPFVMLAAAAAVTDRVRLRTYVLDIGFWNPGLLARDVATLDVLSGGRVEIGLGAGHKPARACGCGAAVPPFRRAGRRARPVRRRAAPAPRRPRNSGPSPCSGRAPVFVGTTSACRASRSPPRSLISSPSAAACSCQGRLPDAHVASAAERTPAWPPSRERRAARGLPPPAFDALIQQVVLDRTAADVAADWEAATAGAIRAADIVDSPFLLVAPSAGRGGRGAAAAPRPVGITSWCTHAPSGPALADVAAVVRALGG